MRIWDTQDEDLGHPSNFQPEPVPRRVHQLNARRFPDATFAQPRNGPGTAIFDRPVDNKSLDGTPTRGDN